VDYQECVQVSASHLATSTITRLTWPSGMQGIEPEVAGDWESGTDLRVGKGCSIRISWVIASGVDETKDIMVVEEGLSRATCNANQRKE
jgi:hypothetical protein